VTAEKYVVVVLPPGWAKQVTRDLAAIKRALGIVITKENEIMTDQEHLDTDVQALGAGLDEIAAEIAALKEQHPAVDFTALDAVVARVQGVATDNAPPADEPAPAE